MTTPSTPSVPPHILRRVAYSVRTIREWNDAIAQARRREALAHQPGRYEYDLRYTDLGRNARAHLAVALQTLDTCEALAREYGCDPAVLYGAEGGRPPLITQGPHVQDWHRSPDKHE